MYSILYTYIDKSLGQCCAPDSVLLLYYSWKEGCTPFMYPGTSLFFKVHFLAYYVRNISKHFFPNSHIFKPASGLTRLI